MIDLIQPVILCGGAGTRLWPLSRTGFPKQFLCLAGDESLFQQAVKRLMSLSGEALSVLNPCIVSSEEHRFLALEQLREAGIELGTALLEPIGRNTAPALTLAALAALDNGNDPVMVVTPSDQTIADSLAFADALHKAVKRAADGAIVILGVTPDRPETGYGYIKTETTGGNEAHSLKVERFVEKPNAAAAQQYLEEGGYFWNAGMFVLRASIWLKALEYYRPDIAQTTRLAWQVRSIDQKFIRPGRAEFAAVPQDSIDYAVMEPATQRSASGVGGTEGNCPFPVEMVPLSAGWNDLGAWDAVWSVSSKDEAGNARVGDVITIGSSNNLVHATSRLVSLVGVENLVVIETPDAVLVANKSSCQGVKQVVKALDERQREEHNLHRKVHRPWGWYDSIDEDHRFKVKRIQVKPKSSLSLQRHHHRAEHWVVVRGTAEITCGDKTILLSENESTYIPLGEIHRLANPGTIPLEIIEIQSGSYLGEDDIVRLEDHYGRSNQ